MKYLKAIRINNIILLSILFWGLTSQHFKEELRFSFDHLWLFLAIIFTLCSGYLINNYYDFNSDIINNKSIKGISKKEYLVYYFINLFLSFLCLFISDLSGGWFQLVMICHFSVFLYSLKTQHIPLLGNLMVAGLCAIAISIPEFISNKNFLNLSFNLQESIAFTFLFFSFGFTLIREIIKDMEDIKGDQKTNSKTLPIVIGIKPSKIIVILISLMMLVMLIYGMLSSPFTMLYILFYFPLIILSVAFIYKAFEGLDQNNYSTLSRLIKLKFFTASIWLYLSHLI
tara:strand:- start:1826 stop:2680 length:855 start_codon:yes stop_codon:yes gene_type:complete